MIDDAAEYLLIYDGDRGAGDRAGKRANIRSLNKAMTGQLSNFRGFG